MNFSVVVNLRFYLVRVAYLYFGAGCMGSEHLVAAVLTVTITNTQGADELVTHITENTRNFIVVVLQHIHTTFVKVK